MGDMDSLDSVQVCFQFDLLPKHQRSNARDKWKPRKHLGGSLPVTSSPLVALWQPSSGSRPPGWGIQGLGAADQLSLRWSPRGCQSPAVWHCACSALLGQHSSLFHLSGLWRTFQGQVQTGLPPWQVVKKIYIVIKEITWNCWIKIVLASLFQTLHLANI